MNVKPTNWARSAPTQNLRQPDGTPSAFAFQASCNASRCARSSSGVISGGFVRRQEEDAMCRPWVVHPTRRRFPAVWVINQLPAAVGVAVSERQASSPAGRMLLAEPSRTTKAPRLLPRPSQPRTFAGRAPHLGLRRQRVLAALLATPRRRRLLQRGRKRPLPHPVGPIASARTPTAVSLSPHVRRAAEGCTVHLGFAALALAVASCSD